MKQPTTEQTQYIEPIGFKGTPGDLWLDYDNCLACGRGDGYYTIAAFEVSTEPDRLLISHSKELAKALQDEVLFLEEWNGYENYTERIERIKQVLKDAGLE